MNLIKFLLPLTLTVGVFATTEHQQKNEKTQKAFTGARSSQGTGKWRSSKGSSAADEQRKQENNSKNFGKKYTPANEVRLAAALKNQLIS